MTSLVVGTLLNMNMISPAMAAMGTNSYDNRYNYDKQPSYNNGYDKSSYFMDSYGDRNNDHKDKKNAYFMDSYGDRNNDHKDKKNAYFMDSYGDRNNDHKDKKNAYFMDSYGDRNNDHKDKIKEYECRTGQFEGFLVSSVEFCFDKNKKFHR
jgi:hypothetical protein